MTDDFKARRALLKWKIVSCVITLEDGLAVFLRLFPVWMSDDIGSS